MKLTDFDYTLPPHYIAQTPIEPRDRSRLMVLDRRRQTIEHRQFYEIVDYLRPGDLMVFNDSRVLPARFFGQTATGARVEILLLRRLGDGLWQVVTRPAKRTKPGVVITIPDPSAGQDLTAEVIEIGDGGTRTVRFSSEEPLERLGHTPLPPYIHRTLDNPERYQTVYARVKGSAAAPTAGLHFTPELLSQLEARGVQFAFVILHIGLDTFRPVRAEDPARHHIHTEYGEISPGAAERINLARREGRRVIAIGTTGVRLLEAAAEPPDAGGVIRPLAEYISLFILPGYRFRAVDAMVTNFHLPRSTLLMLVSAFAGHEFILHAYTEAQRLGYRFYSFGDAMLIF